MSLSHRRLDQRAYGAGTVRPIRRSVEPSLRALPMACVGVQLEPAGLALNKRARPTV